MSICSLSDASGSNVARSSPATYSGETAAGGYAARKLVGHPCRVLFTCETTDSTLPERSPMLTHMINDGCLQERHVPG